MARGGFVSIFMLWLEDVVVFCDMLADALVCIHYLFCQRQSVTLCNVHDLVVVSAFLPNCSA